MTAKSTLFEYWKQTEVRRGERITVADVVRSTGLQRNTVQGMLDGTTTRFDASVIDALCKFFDVPEGVIPFLVYVVE